MIAAKYHSPALMVCNMNQPPYGRESLKLRNSPKRTGAISFRLVDAQSVGRQWQVYRVSYEFETNVPHGKWFMNLYLTPPG
mgnify:FL=1